MAAKPLAGSWRQPVAVQVSTVHGSPSSSGCEDGDPCTVDTCTATGCLHDPASGFAAIVCALPAPGLQPCAGEQIPGAVTQLLDQSRSLISRATTSSRPKQT